MSNNQINTQTYDLVKQVDQYELHPDIATSLKESFLPFFVQANEWKIKADSLVVTSASQKEEMAQAREARRALVRIRTEADRTRKLLKEDSLRYGKAVQGLYNLVEYLVVPIEEHLERQEKFVELEEKRMKAELKAKREMDAQPYREFIPYIDFGNITDEDFDKLINGAKLQMQAKLDAEAKVKAERERQIRIAQLQDVRKNDLIPVWQFVETEKRTILGEMSEEEFESIFSSAKLSNEKWLAEQARIKAENERLAKEKAEAEAKAKAERDKLEAELQAQRAAKEKAEAQLRAKAEAEAKAKAEAEAKAKAEAKAEKEAEKRAKNAPDKVKLATFIQGLRTIQIPALSDENKPILERFIKEHTNLLNEFDRVINEL